MITTTVSTRGATMRLHTDDVKDIVTFKVCLDPKIKDAVPPTRAYETDSGWDLYSPGHYCIGQDPVIVDTGIRVSTPPGWGFQVRGRSGMAFNKGIGVHLGTIDHGYQGNIKVLVYKLHQPYDRELCVVGIDKGDKIAQLVLERIPVSTYYIADSFDKLSERNTNGFGSSGR